MSDNTASNGSESIYRHNPSHIAPAVLAGIIGASLLFHIYQNFRYRFWRITFFMFWAGTVFTAGWICRIVSTYHPLNLNWYIAQTVLIYAGPPIYSAAEYNMLGRMIRYLPMHAPFHPGRTVTFFVYLGVAVESLTAAGASQLATAKDDDAQYRTGKLLMSIALVLQGLVECLFIYLVVKIQRRCVRTKMFPRNVRTLCIMLYGTSSLILFRCIFRAIESFSTLSPTGPCDGLCRIVRYDEWYLYVFEAAPMILYTYWINIVHPGRLLPSERDRYLDLDGKTERLGPGWVDNRSWWQTFADPLDVKGVMNGQANHDQFWFRPQDWPEVADGSSFALGTATNVLSRKSGSRHDTAVLKKGVAHNNTVSKSM